MKTAVLVACVLAGSLLVGTADAKRPRKGEQERGDELRAVARAAGSLDDLFVPVDGPIVVTADHATFDEENGLLDGRGNVRITVGNAVLRCDHVAVDLAAQQAVADGSCELHRDATTLRFASATVQLDSLEGVIVDADVDGIAGRYRFEAGRIHRLASGEIYIGDGWFSPCGCDGRTPAWGVEARFVRITPEGKVHYRRGWFQVGRKRVLPIQSGRFDGVTGRASGLLMPDIRLGGSQPFRATFPLYLATSRNTDLTLSPAYVHTRGFLLGSEFRYAVAPGQGGSISSSFIRDAALLQQIQERHQQVYPDAAAAGYSEMRFWGQWRHYQRSRLAHFGAHVDLLRDDMILQDFEQNYGMRRTPYLISRIHGGLRHKRGIALARVEVVDQVSSVRNAVALHGLPRLTFGGTRMRTRPLKDLRLSADLMGDARYVMAFPGAWQGDLWYEEPFVDAGTDGVMAGTLSSEVDPDRTEGNTIYNTGEPVHRTLRTHVRGRLTATWTPGGWLWVNPWVEGEGTLYGLFRHHDKPGYQATMLGGVVLGTALYRDFDTAAGGWRHVVEPELSWEAQPFVVEGVHPVLDYRDWQYTHNRLQLELTNRLIRHGRDAILKTQPRSQALEVRVAAALELDREARFDEDRVVEPMLLEMAYRHRFGRFGARTVVAWQEDPVQAAGVNGSLAHANGNQLFLAYDWALGGTERLWSAGHWYPLLHGGVVDANVHEVSMGLRWIPYTFLQEVVEDRKRIFRGFAVRAAWRVNLREEIAANASRLLSHDYSVEFTSPCSCWRAGVDLRFASDWSSPSFGFNFALLTK